MATRSASRPKRSSPLSFSPVSSIHSESPYSSSCADSDYYDESSFQSDSDFYDKDSLQTSYSPIQTRQKSLFWVLFALVTLIKLLLFPSYSSTDFEVHRNWLAITYNLPISRWYVDSTSQWTLDYPPLFAWFEYALSQLAAFVDPEMLQLSSEPVKTAKTIQFQRSTVIVTDLLYAIACYECWLMLCNIQPLRRLNIRDELMSPPLLLAFLLLWAPGLLLVDHIHFQYNGLLTGLLLLSIVRMMQQRLLESAFLFTVLLNFKHLYLYVAPAYFVYLLRTHCVDVHSKRIRWYQLIQLGSVVLSVLFISLGPFVWFGQIGQLLSRLFPFKRGLSHAYWAPNFWALYNGLDKVLSILTQHAVGDKGRMTGGLVQEFDHQMLPTITPIVCIALVVSSLIPILIKLWQHPTPMTFLRACILCAFSSFLFGWHVHEKAILMIIIPFAPLSLISSLNARLFLLLSTAGTFSLFPLLFESGETPTKVLLLLAYTVYAYAGLCEIHRYREQNQKLSLLRPLELLYLFGLVVLQFHYSFGNQLLGLDAKLPFLPLLLTSLYTSLAVVYSWLRFYRESLLSVL